MSDKVRSRNWCLVLYPDDPTHVECIEKLTLSYKIAAILHDKDTWEDGESENHAVGEAKKAHWHVVLKFQQARWRNAISEELGIAPNYLEVCRNTEAALLYLVHDGFPNKYQYDSEAVFGDLKPNLLKLLAPEDEGSRVKEIVHIIDACPGKCSYREVLLKCCDNGLYGEFRRLGAGVGYLIKEHNEDFYETLYKRDNKPNNDEFAMQIERNENMDWVERLQRLERQKIPPIPMD